MSTQLTYGLTSSPDPLQVGNKGALTLVASAQRAGVVTLTSITVTIPIGSGTQSLADTSNVIAASAPEGWTIGGNAAQGSFIFTPPEDGDNGLSGGLVFAFTNIPVNDSPGTATITVTENSAANYVTFPVSKFPADFYLNALVATPTTVNAGDSSTLSWSGSPGYTYAISPADKLAAPIDPDTNEGSVQTVDLDQNTIFTLTVSNGDNQNSFVTQETAGVTVYPPTISDFTINGETSLSDVALDAPLALSWTATNADHVVILVNNIVLGMFAADDTEATLTAGFGGSYRAVAYFGEISGGIHSPPSDPVTLSLAPPTATISVTPTDVYADYSSVTLDWTTTNATSAKLQTGAQGSQFPVDLNASDYNVYPQSSTQYTLTAIYDPEQARTTSSAAAMTVPQSMLSDSSGDSGYTETTAQVTLTLNPCPLQVFTTTLNPGTQNHTYTLPRKATAAASYLAAFNYTFSEDKKHNLLTWEATGTASLDSAGTTLNVNRTMVLDDDSDNHINSDATLTLVTICWNDEDTGSYLTNIAGKDGVNNFTFPGTGYEAVTSALTRFKFWSSSSKGKDGEVKKLGLYVTQPSSSDITPDTTDDTTNVYITFGYWTGGDQHYYYQLSFSPLATIATQQGSGFGIAVADEGQASVSFDQPVSEAYTFLCQWKDTGDGKEHTVQLLLSDYVQASPNGTTVNLQWDQALWNDGKHDPWNATRQIVVLGCYGDRSNTVGPS